MVGVPGVHCQAMLARARFKIAYVGVQPTSAVITAAWFRGSRTASLPAVVKETDRVAAELGGGAPYLRTAPSCLAASFSAACGRTGVAAGGLCGGLLCAGLLVLLLLRSVPPPLAHLAVRQGRFAPVGPARGLSENLVRKLLHQSENIIFS